MTKLEEPLLQHLHSQQLMLCVYEGGPQKLEFIYKTLSSYSYTLKLQSLSKSSPFGVAYLSGHFSTAQNSFWTYWSWCLLALLPFLLFLLFHLFHIGKTFPSEYFFIWGNKNKVSWGEISWIGRVGNGGHVGFGQKLLNTQRGVGRCAHKSPIMKWANVLKGTSKKLTEAEGILSQQHQLVHWYRRVPRTIS